MDTSKYKAIFLQETYDHLTKIEKRLLALDEHPSDKSIIDALFRHYHSIKGMCASMGFEVMQKFSHAQEELLDKYRGSSAAVPSPKTISILLQCLDVLKEMTGRVEEDLPIEIEIAPYLKMLQSSASNASTGGADARPSAAPVTQRRPEATAASPELKLAKTMKVDGKVFDDLLKITGELLTSYSGIKTIAGASRSIELREGAHVLGKSIKELHEKILSARMLPFSDLTMGLPRIVHDLSKDSGKLVDLVVKGGEIRLDRAILEGMGDPLVHIIRNSVDHGAETPEQRRSVGKPPRATVTIEASAVKDHVVIEVRDDGRGIDLNKLRQKAVSSGFDQKAIDSISNKETLMLICHPGLSLAEKVTEVSGRGVGMNVVKVTVEALSGSLQIESTLGLGTKFVMRLPRTSSIIRVLLVTVGEDIFSIPMSKIEKILEVAKTETTGNTVRYRDGEIPLIGLKNVLGVESSNRGSEEWLTAGQRLRSNGESTTVIIVKGGHDGRRLEDLMGIEVDDFTYEIDAYINPNIPPFSRLWGVVGYSIMGDGRPVFLLDVAQITSRTNPAKH